MRFLRRTPDDRIGSGSFRTPPPGPLPDPDPPPQVLPRALSLEQREQIDQALQRGLVGDAIERRLFLAALDYQLAVFAERLALTPVAEQQVLIRQVCSAAASGLGAPSAVAAERACVAFVGELARAFDACFETRPTDDERGPFRGILAGLRKATGLTLPCDHRLIDQALGSPGAS